MVCYSSIQHIEVNGWTYYNNWIYRKLQINGIQYYSDPNEIDSEVLGTGTRGDGIPDNIEYEKNTNPMSEDTDMDGINDGFEMLLYSIDYNLNYIRAWNSIPDNHEPDPLRKDIYVEVDWMGFGGGDDSEHKLNTKAKNKIIQTYRDSPLYNVDGTRGIDIHIDDGTGDWESIGRGKEVTHDNTITYTEFRTIYVDNYFDRKDAGVFHYNLMAHAKTNKPNTRGTATMGRYYFVLFDDKIDNSDEQAHVFLHELGHNLGLDADDCYWDDEKGFWSRRYPIIPDDKYPSSMRYGTDNSNKGFTGYSNKGSFFDDLDVWYETDDIWITIPQNDWLHMEFDCL